MFTTKFVRVGSLICLLASSALALNACAPQGVASSQTDANDVCRAERLALDDTRGFFAGDIVRGAVTGAAVGAVGGLLASGGRNAGKAIAIGATTGAVAGGLAGYWTSLHNQGLSRNDLFARLSGDLEEENRQLDRAQTSFNALTDCRKREAAKINADLRAGNITRPVAEERMAQLRTWAQQDIVIAQQINKRIQDRTGNFVYATEQATGKPVVVQAAARPSGTPTRQQATSQQRVRTAAPAQAAANPADSVQAGASSLAQKQQAFGASVAAAQSLDSLTIS